MQRVCNFIRGLSWATLIIICLTLGLAPFFPEPHIWEKLKMLVSGTLSRPIDIFDILLHGTPWVVLIIKASLCRGAADAEN